MPIHNPSVSKAVTLVRKAVDEVVNNSDVLQDDDELKFDIGANEDWEAVFILLNISVSDTPNMAVGFTVPGGATFYCYIITMATGGTGFVMANLPRAGIPHTIDAETTITLNAIIRIIVVNGATPGVVQLQWAQGSATAEDTTMKENSLLMAHKLQ